jgi:hypothetical protein
VDGVVREVDEERFVAVLLDEADCLAGETVGEVFPVWPVGQVREGGQSKIRDCFCAESAFVFQKSVTNF